MSSFFIVSKCHNQHWEESPAAAWDGRDGDRQDQEGSLRQNPGAARQQGAPLQIRVRGQVRDYFLSFFFGTYDKVFFPCYRSAGSIPGVSSTQDNKTFPTIQVIINCCIIEKLRPRQFTFIALHWCLVCTKDASDLFFEKRLEEIEKTTRANMEV